jgi:hypothetical protein
MGRPMSSKKGRLANFRATIALIDILTDGPSSSSEGGGRIKIQHQDTPEVPQHILLESAFMKSS